MKATYEKPLCVICVIGRDVGTDVVTVSYFYDSGDPDDPFDADY